MASTWTSTPLTLILPWLLTTTLVYSAVPRDPQLSRLKTVYAWSQVDFAYPTPADRQAAIADGSFISANHIPFGLDIWEDRIFVTFPRLIRDGIAATVATIPRVPTRRNVSLIMKPYPDWSWQDTRNCDKLISVFRIAVDSCGRLWIVDSARPLNPTQICPPKILVFDLQTDRLIRRYDIPPDQIRENSLFGPIVTDVRGGRCDAAYAYIADVWGFGLLVYSWQEKRSWRATNSYFYPDPLACPYNTIGVEYCINDGVFGLALSPYNLKTRDRSLFFHPMTSFREFVVSTSVLRNETALAAQPDAFRVLGEPRGKVNWQSSASVIDRNGIMYYNLVSQEAVACWNSNNPGGYIPELQGTVDRSDVSLVFPSDVKIDSKKRQSIWVLSNNFPVIVFGNMTGRYRNRILRAFTDVAVDGTVCDPRWEETLYHDDGSYLEGCGSSEEYY